MAVSPAQSSPSEGKPPDPTQSRLFPAYATRSCQSHFFIKERAEAAESDRMIKLLQIKTPNAAMTAENLSGGNQQKIVIAKWLLGDLKLLILDEPTRGIDVGSKSEIHRLMVQFARQGLAVIMISSELPEVLGMSDRVVVMSGGRVTGELARSEANPENVMQLATGGHA